MTRDDQLHHAVDMVAQQGQTLPEGSNTEPRPNTQFTPLVIDPTMAASAGAHDPAAMASGPTTNNVMELFDLSVSPPNMKDDVMGGQSRRRAAPMNSRDRSRDRDRSGSRSASVKRSSDATIGRPPRGRPDSPWEDDIRAVHRRVQYPDNPNASVQNALEALRRQSEADR